MRGGIATGRQVVQGGGEGVLVRARVACALVLLRRRIARRADRGAALCGGRACQAEVDDHHLPVGAQDHVPRLQIAEDDRRRLPVQVRERGGELARPGQRHRRGYAAPVRRRLRGQGVPRHEPEHQERRIPVLPDIADGAEVRVAQPGQDRHLARVPGLPLSLLLRPAAGERDPLDGPDPPRQPLVGGLPYLAEAAAAKARHQQVAPADEHAGTEPTRGRSGHPVQAHAAGGAVAVLPDRGAARGACWAHAVTHRGGHASRSVRDASRRRASRCALVSPDPSLLGAALVRSPARSAAQIPLRADVPYIRLLAKAE